MGLSTLKFLEIPWIRNLSKKPCLLVKDEVLLFIFVDYILVVSKTKQAYERFRDLLKAAYKIKELGKTKHILGVRVEFVKNGISLGQR